MPTIDIEMAQLIHSQMNIHGVNLILNDGLKEFRQNGRELLLNQWQNPSNRYDYFINRSPT